MDTDTNSMYEFTIDPSSLEVLKHLITEARDCEREKLRVVAAAVLRENVIYALPPPRRHHDVVHAMHDRGLPQRGSDEQGFLLNNGGYATRRAAGSLALCNTQIMKLAHPYHGLFSEDVW